MSPKTYDGKSGPTGKGTYAGPSARPPNASPKPQIKPCTNCPPPKAPPLLRVAAAMSELQKGAKGTPDNLKPLHERANEVHMVLFTAYDNLSKRAKEPSERDTYRQLADMHTKMAEDSLTLAVPDDYELEEGEKEKT